MITKFKKLAVVGVAVVSSLALMGTVAFAQNINPMSVNITNSGAAHISGTVTAVSGSTISVSSWGGTWTITTSGSLANIAVGDNVRAQGQVSSGMNITAKKIVEFPVQGFKKINGTISNFNSTAGTFTLSMGNKTVSVVTNASTQVMVNGAVSTIASLANGMKVTVLGTFDANTNTITASSITAPAISLDNDHKTSLREKIRGWAWGLFGKK